LGGVHLEGDAWTSAKAKELLLYLVCHPAGCTREDLGLAFWPDASTAQVKNSFHVLRIAFDVEQFEHELAEAQREPQRLEQMLARHQGDFGAGDRRLMLCYARTGQRDRALRHFERLTKTLATELDAKPELQSVQLAERIRRAEAV
jgi:DNA-binding SARP family transcriptional activator